jgi:hypothetical protein
LIELFSFEKPCTFKVQIFAILEDYRIDFVLNEFLRSNKKETELNTLSGLFYLAAFFTANILENADWQLYLPGNS